MKKFLGLIILFYGLFSFYTAYIGYTSGVVEQIPQAIFSGLLGFIALIIGIALLKKKKNKSESNNDVEDEQENEEIYRESGHARPFSKHVMKFLVMIFSFGIAGIIAYIDKENLIFKIGEFIFGKMLIFFVVFLIIGIISCKNFIKYGQYDLQINAAFLMQNNQKIGIKQIFCNYFGSMYAQGPLIYSDNDLKIKNSRQRVLLLTTLFRYICTIIALIGIIEIVVKVYANMNSYEDMLNMAIYGKASVGFIILLFGPSIDILLYVFGKMIPGLEAKQYKVTTYYTDGTSESRIETKTNIFALLIMGGIVYVYYVGWFWGPTARNLIRLIETKKFGKFCDEYSNVNIFDFYR